MDQSLRRFARRILLLHLALLVPLLAVVYFASRQVYRSAREQAQEQAQKQQSLLVNETASALKGYYDSIFADLELFKPISPDDDDTEDRIPEEETGLSPVRARAFRVPPMLAQQLNGRVAHLFLVEKKRYNTIAYGQQPTSPTVAELVAHNHDWIDSLDKPAVSPLEQLGDPPTKRGYTLIGVPVGPKRNFVLVASVPIRGITKRYFDEVNSTGNSEAFLLDSTMTILSGSRPGMMGTQINPASAPELADALKQLGARDNGGTRLLARPFTLGPESFVPAMVTLQPLTVLDRQWYVLIASPLSNSDEMVNRLFRWAGFGAVGVALLMTAILVSTAVQLIRNRARSDRERHQLLERELKQAREIQLAWLPQKRTVSGWLDIATVNHPASRISGDFYNWFELPDGRTVVAIGDVTGHGMGAAFLMATTQLLVRNTMPQTGDPGRCLEEINRQLCNQVFNGQFVTLQILVFHPQDNRVSIGTAGHPPPLYADGESFQPLKLEPHLVLGVERDADYATCTFELAPGASLLLYTDGVVDTESPGEERFGFDRLRRCLYGRFESAQNLIDAVLAAINKFRNNRPLCDDLTLVAIQPQFDVPQEPSPERRRSASVT